ncbi:MAG: hypothetical protein ACFCD0_00255 [Gemmataceae bacterium]
MGCDMVVALGPATVNRSTIFGLNSHRPAQELQNIVLNSGARHSPGEMVRVQHMQLSQTKRTFTTLGCQPENCWGYLHGINEHHVAIGCSNWGSLVKSKMQGLLGTDLVRLALERTDSARHAVELLTSLITRHGQGRFAGFPSATEEDHVFMVADPREAFTVEAAGKYWALQQILEIRASGDVSVIRQDWNRISPGLAAHAIDNGWWMADGSKLDFAGSLNTDPTGRASALRRWGRLTYMMESQNGAIDNAFLRQVLSDHYETTPYEVDPLHGPMNPTPLCRHDFGRSNLATSASFIVELVDAPDGIAIAWCAFGPPCISLYFPLILAEGALPTAFSEDSVEFRYQNMWNAWAQLREYMGFDRDCWKMVRERLAWLQSRLDQETDDFLQEVTRLRREGGLCDVPRLAGLLMENHLEQFDAVLHGILGPAEPLVASA